MGEVLTVFERLFAEEAEVWVRGGETSLHHCFDCFVGCGNAVGGVTLRSGGGYGRIGGKHHASGFAGNGDERIADGG